MAQTFPTMLYYEGGLTCIARSEKELQSRLEAGWTQNPPVTHSGVSGELASKRAYSPTTEESKFPTMLYHPVYPPQKVNTEEEKQMCLKKGWSETPIMGDNEEILVAKIAETETILDEMKAKLELVRTQKKAAAGGIIIIEPPKVAEPLVPLVSEEAKQEPSPPEPIPEPKVDKRKRPMSQEQKDKMQAGRERVRAEKRSAKSEATP